MYNVNHDGMFHRIGAFAEVLEQALFSGDVLLPGADKEAVNKPGTGKRPPFCCCSLSAQ